MEVGQVQPYVSTNCWSFERLPHFETCRTAYANNSAEADVSVELSMRPLCLLSGRPSTFPTLWCSIGKICHTSNLIEKFNCFYCSYGNGVAAYACEVAAHDRYSRFFEYGDAEADWQGPNRLRRQYEDEERK